MEFFSKSGILLRKSLEFEPGRGRKKFILLYFMERGVDFFLNNCIIYLYK